MSDSAFLLQNILVVQENGEVVTLEKLKNQKPFGESGELEPHVVSLSAYVTTNLTDEQMKELTGVMFLCTPNQLKDIEEFDGLYHNKFSTPLDGGPIVSWSAPAIGQTLQISSTNVKDGQYYVQYFVRRQLIPTTSTMAPTSSSDAVTTTTVTASLAPSTTQNDVTSTKSATTSAISETKTMTPTTSPGSSSTAAPSTTINAQTTSAGVTTTGNVETTTKSSGITRLVLLVALTSFIGLLPS
ncbi:hypothetical protein CAEBREN_08935 [Caenorhabditis brenneri]|uniref:Uncharacterized protein n=1 Tax=Caenorhabditis brenneri TaxID=135651 RepID=G0M8X2_CAEBE|nr:hypothetical protein CAEBREN_08935 [Caenorhabditis brenneri]